MSIQHLTKRIFETPYRVFQKRTGKQHALVDLLAKIAKEKNVSNAQIALAWLLAQKPWIVAVPGTTRVHRLEENVAAATVSLSANDVKEINNALSKIEVQGARYSEQAQKMINR